MVFLYILIVLAVLFLLTEWCIFRFAISRNGLNLPWVDAFGGQPSPWEAYMDSINEGKQWLHDTPHEEVDITSRDGLKLHGHLFLCEGEAERTALCCHGYRSSWDLDFSMSARLLVKRGFNVLLMDQRTHGESGGKHICFGVRERYDVLDWCRFINGRFGEELPVYLMGVSMGSSTVLLAAGLDLPGNVKGIVGDCGFTSPTELFKYEMKHLFRMPWQPFLWMFKLFCHAFAGFDPDCSAPDALRRSGLPVLIVHGGADDFVPTAMSHVNYDACTGYRDLLIVEGCGHGCAFPAATDEYLAREEKLLEYCENKGERAV